MTTASERSRLAPLAVAIALIVVIPSAAFSQRDTARIVVGAAAVTPVRVQPGASFSVPVLVDMNGATGINLAALTASVSWDRSVARLDSVKSGRPSFGTLVHNAARAGEGILLLSAFNSSGTTQTVSIATLYFTASSAPASTTIVFEPTVAGNEVGQSIIARVRSRNAQICLGSTTGPCTAGRAQGPK
jgi:hypothetical protein